MKEYQPAVLSIAGIDPSGGAGIFADFRAIEAQGVRALGAVTALTVQTENSFLSYEPTNIEMLKTTITAMKEAYPECSVKTGMLPTSECVKAVAEMLDRFKFPHVVIDPVIVASVGARLVDEAAQEAIKMLLLPRATLLTPNMPEASALSGIKVTDILSMKDAGRKLVDYGAKTVVVTGGHLEGAAIDVLVNENGCQLFESPRKPGSVHGTGCSFASAAAAALARGEDTASAVQMAKDFVSSLFDGQRWRV